MTTSPLPDGLRHPVRLPDSTGPRAAAALLFVGFGLCTEIVFTGLAGAWEGSFRGQVSLLMVPVYALAYFAIGAALWALEQVGAKHLAVRVAAGVTMVYAIEWSFGLLFGSLGLRPWHYEHGWASDFSGGWITLYYLPAWALFVVLAERVWRIASTVAPHVDEAIRHEVRAITTRLR